jgi:hypothetical protein
VTDPTGMHQIATSLPDDLFERFDADRVEADRNVSQQLRWVVREYYRMVDRNRQTVIPGVPRASQETRIMPKVPTVLPTEPRKLEPYVGRTDPTTTITFDDGHRTT